jgi:hypothetical protein
MKAVLRVWWTFFTAVALQRVLCVIGCVLLGLGILGWLLSGESVWFPFGYLAFVALVGAPALWAAPVLFRWLSAPRMCQLLPHFRRRMLTAVSLLLGALLVAVFVFLVPEMILDSTPLSMLLGYPIAFLVAVFLVLFLAFGDPRWFILVPIAVVALQSPATARILAALPASSLGALALGAWAVFAAWYLRVPQVRGVMLNSQGRSGVDATRPVSQTVAIRVLLGLTARNTKRQISPRSTLFVFAALVVGMTLITQSLRSLSLTSFLWPLMLMVMSGGTALNVRQSRLLWLRIPGARDAVRRAIEQALWRNLAVTCGFLVVVAAIAASPLVGQGATEVALGFALLAGAAIYSTYLALAAVPSTATYFWGVGSMALLLFPLLVLSGLSPTAWSLETGPLLAAVETAGSLKTVAIVTAIELAGAALLRILAVRRWRTVDWLRFKPHASLVGVPRSP